MFISNGFNDFLAKPIDSDELRMILNKHLPPEKVKTEIVTNEQQDSSIKEQALLNKAAVTFVKENQSTSFKIVDALNSGDIKTAHRIAHTLKSSSGYLGRKELQEAAGSLELSLTKEPPEYSKEQLNTIEEELNKALRDFGVLLKEAESAKPEAVQVSNEELTSLLDELKPLLENADFGASKYVEKLQSIEGLEELAARIDDYDFEGALEILLSLEQN
jgi:HPt (histidine-containing phosphotransfer) domain-containing protein